MHSRTRANKQLQSRALANLSVLLCTYSACMHTQICEFERGVWNNSFLLYLSSSCLCLFFVFQVTQMLSPSTLFRGGDTDMQTRFVHVSVSVYCMCVCKDKRKEMMTIMTNKAQERRERITSEHKGVKYRRRKSTEKDIEVGKAGLIT